MIVLYAMGMVLMVGISAICLVRSRCVKCGRWGLLADVIDSSKHDETEVTMESSESGEREVHRSTTTTTVETDRVTCPSCGHEREITKVVSVSNSDMVTSPVWLLVAFLMLTGPLMILLSAHKTSYRVLQRFLPDVLAVPGSYLSWLLQVVIVLGTYAILMIDRTLGLWKWGVVLCAWLCILVGGMDPLMNDAPRRKAPVKPVPEQHGAPPEGSRQ